MPERTPDHPPSTDFLLGQITAQLREMVHSQNNTTMAMTGLEQGLGKRIDGTNTELRALSARVSALESANERREGATGVVSAILRSPVIGWVVGGVVTLWAILTGKIHL